MEEPLRQPTELPTEQHNTSRNPYYNGRASKTNFLLLQVTRTFLVAILIIMEEPLRHFSKELATQTTEEGRNPYYNGRASKTSTFNEGN